MSLSDGIRAGVPASVRPSVHTYRHETSWPIIIKFHIKHHLGEGLAALCFGPDRIRTLVSMATDSSHRVVMGKSCEHSSSFIFHWIFFILAGNKDSNKSLDGFEIRQEWTRVCGVGYP